MPNVNRRSVLVAGFVSALASPTFLRAQEASPASDAMPPEEILRALLSTPVTSPLLPGDRGPLAAVEWVDDSDTDLIDTDLIDTVGGVLIQADDAESTFAAVIGAYLVHRTPNDAANRFNPNLQVDPLNAISVFGLEGGFQRIPGTDSVPDSSLIAIPTGVVSVSAIAMGDDPVANDLRALATLAGLLDHLRLATGGQAPFGESSSS